MNSFLFIYKKTFKINLFEFFLGSLNISIITTFLTIFIGLESTQVLTLNIIVSLMTFIIMASTIILCLNSEFLNKIRDICILRVIGFQKYSILFFSIINSIIIVVLGIFTGIVIGQIILFAVFKIGFENITILNIITLGFISALIACISPLIKISKLKVPKVLNL
jgi:ABC-type antimicrobial peptide transport system permease subunit